MNIGFDFPPDKARAQRIDRRMRAQLLESIDYLRAALKEQLGESVEGLDGFIMGLREGAVCPPSTFGLYYEVTAQLMNADASSARPLFDELVREQAMSGTETRVMTLDQVAPESRRMRYQRLMDTDPDTPFRILSPLADDAAVAVQRFTSGMNRLRQTIPELAGEFEALIREVILVIGDPQLGYDFAGGSCYMLWGSLFINAGGHASDVAVIEAIAHESCHSLLFGLTIDEPLVLNDDKELFSSPLRDDPRPMDGIYHATYVSARMHWAMSALLACGQLSGEEIEQATASREADRRSFWSGFATVRECAALSATGRLLMEGAHQYMKPFEAA